MTKNPFYNAGLGIIYITLVVTIMNAASKWATEKGGDTILMPIGVLSLFVFSAATMGYLFLFQPITMFLDNNRKAAVNLFLQTIGTFAGLAAIVVAIAYMIYR